MRTIAIALSILLATAGAAHASIAAGGPAAADITLSPKLIQLAGSFHNSNAKLGDKTLTGQAGGIYGIGGGEPHVKYFKNRMSKIPRCCAASR